MKYGVPALVTVEYFLIKSRTSEESAVVVDVKAVILLMLPLYVITYVRLIMSMSERRLSPVAAVMALVDLCVGRSVGCPVG